MSKDKSEKSNARIADRLSAEELAAIRAALEGGEDAEQSQNAVPDGEQPDANGKNRNRDAATEVSERDTDGKGTDFTEAGTGVKGNDVGHAKETETNGQNGNSKKRTHRSIPTKRSGRKPWKGFSKAPRRRNLLPRIWQGNFWRTPNSERTATVSTTL